MPVGESPGLVHPDLEKTKATTMTRENWIAAQKQDPALINLIIGT